MYFFYVLRGHMFSVYCGRVFLIDILRSPFRRILVILSPGVAFFICTSTVAVWCAINGFGLFNVRRISALGLVRLFSNNKYVGT